MMRKIFVFIVFFCILNIYFYLKFIKKLEINDIETWSAEDEWLRIGQYGFLRKDTAQYLLDKKVLLIFLLIRKEKDMPVEGKFELFVNVFYNGELFSKLRIAPNITEIFYFNLYQVNFLQTDFDLDCVFYKRKFNLNDVKIKILVIQGDIKNLYNQDELIDVRVKYYRDTQKSHQNSIICVEPIFLKGYQFPDFQWWVEMAKMSGYKKIALYNNSIENSEIFNNFFSNYDNSWN